MGRARRLAVRIVAVLALLTFNFMVVYVISDAAAPVGAGEQLVSPGSPEARYGAEHPGETVHLVGAIAALAMGVGGLAGLVLRPERAGSATHAGLAALGWILVSVVVGNPDNHGGQAGPVDPAFLVLALPALVAALLAAPWRGWSRRIKRPGFLVLALLGAPWLWFGLRQALLQRSTWPPMADPHHQAHWFVLSLVAVLAVFLTAGAALPGQGWRPAAVTTAVAAIGLGVASLAAPQAASALPPVWGVSAAIWGATIAGLTLRRGSRGRRGLAHPGSLSWPDS